MRVFDVNAMIGAYFSPREGHFPSVVDYLEEMDEYGIDEAMVFHGLASEYDTRYGNHQLLAILQGHERLHPCWILDYPQFGLPTFTEDIEEGIQHGVRLIRFHWGGLLANLSVLDLDLLGSLFAALESHRLPVLLSNAGMVEITGEQLRQVKSICQAFPALPVILTSPKLNQDFALVYHMLTHYENCHLDTSSIHQMGVMEEITRRFGVHHLIFGTNFPWCGAGQSRIALAYADLAEAEKDAIASGNLRRLVEGVR